MKIIDRIFKAIGIKGDSITDNGLSTEDFQTYLEEHFGNSFVAGTSAVDGIIQRVLLFAEQERLAGRDVGNIFPGATIKVVDDDSGIVIYRGVVPSRIDVLKKYRVVVVDENTQANNHQADSGIQSPTP